MNSSEELTKISPSQINMWMNCPEAWNKSYIQGIKRKGSKIYFDKGNYFHELVHVYYQTLAEGQKPGSPFMLDYMESRMKRALTGMNIEQMETVLDVTEMIRAFITLQSPIIDKGIIVEGVEHVLELEVELPSGRRVILNGIVDLIYRDSRKHFIIRDHKTTSQLKSWKPEKLPLLFQLLFYAAVYYKQTGTLVKTVEINAVNSYNYKTKRPTLDEQFKLVRHEHTEIAIERFWDYLLQLIDRMLLTPPMPMYGDTCFSCQYKDICGLELKGMNPNDLINAYYEKVTREYRTFLTVAGDSEVTS